MRQGLLFLLLVNAWQTSWSLCPVNCRCDRQLTDCSYANFSSLPQDIDPNVVTLDVSNNFLVEGKLPSDLQNLQLVNLSKNKLVLSDFPKLNALYEIDLSHNNISNLAKVNLVNLNALKILHLSQNGPFGALRYLKSRSLEYLDISDSYITHFDSDFKADLPKLRSLVVKINKIRSLNQLESTSLSFLDVSEGEISHITSLQLYRLPNLLFLNVSGNEKLRLSLDTSVDCHPVEHAIFSRISLSNIEISYLCKIQEIDLSLNSVKEILGHTFVRNKNLKTLNLSFNHIESLHDNAFSEDNQLMHIDMDNNRIQNGKWTHSLTNLIRLNISNNKISSLYDFMLPKLLFLKISYNNIDSIDIDFTTNFPKLENLDASHNSIEYLPKIRSKTINVLNLAYCQIQNIPEGAFDSLDKLHFLYLDGNKLVRVDSNVFSSVGSLSVIGLAHNPWSCNCKSERFHNLYEYLLVNNTLTNPSELKCADPANMTWQEACQNEWSNKTEKSTAMETFLAILVLFAACCIGVGCVIFFKFRQKRRELTGNRDSTDVQIVVQNESYSPMRRSQSASQMDYHYRTQDQTNVRESALPPPSYEEALLLPPLSDVERLTRSMDVLVERQITTPPSPDSENPQEL